MAVVDPEHWRRLRRILDVALTLPLEERGRWLDAACAADPALRADIERVLRADAESGGLLDMASGMVLDEIIRHAWRGSISSPTQVTNPSAREVLATYSTRSADPQSDPAARFPTMTRFAFRRLLGSGGFGVVYEAFDCEQSAVVALKTLHRADPTKVSHLKREFRSLADTVHPNLVALYELLSDGARWFFTMALVEGVRFDQYVRHNPHEIRSALAQLADGVHALHSAGKLHQDLKPSNVLVTSEGRVVILDFGLVADIGSDGRVASRAGTLPYMAPERLRSYASSAASDCYSIGVMLYQALTGRLPGSRDALEGQLDAAPRDLAVLCQELLDTDPVARPSAREIVGRLSPQSSVPLGMVRATIPFVGRTTEMDRLRGACRTAAAGDCAIVFVEGASGVGKTALVQRFLSEVAGSDEACILSGRCHPQESVPYNALDEVVEQMAVGLVGAHTDDLAAAAHLFPILNPDAARPGVYSQELRHVAAAALRSLIVSLTRRGTLVVYVDDLQWASADSVWLLSKLLQTPAIPRSMWILSSRESVEIPAVATAPTRLELAELSAACAVELTERLLPRDTPEPEARTAHIIREAGGNPFLIVELALSADRDPTGSLDAMLTTRLSRLDLTAQRLLEIVAIAGDPVDRAVAWGASGQRGARQAAISVLRSNRLVLVNGRGELEPYHDRIRHAVQTRLPPATTAERHLALAEELEASGRGSSESLAVHFLEGGDRGKALRHAIAAAEQASHLLAFDSAVRFYRMALALDPDTKGLRESLADALSNAGRGAEAAALYLECVPGADVSRQLYYRRRAATELLISGHTQRGIETLQGVLTAAGLGLSRSALSALPSLLLLRARVRMRGIELRRHPSRRDETERMEALWAAAQGLAMVDSLRAAAFHARHLLLALDSGDRSRGAKALAIEAGYHAMFGIAGRPQGARALSLATQLADASGDPHAIGLTRVVAGMTAFLEGRWSAAREALADAEALLRERCSGVAWELATARLVGCVSMFFLGDIRALQVRVPALLDSAVARGNVYESTHLQVRIAHAIHLARDEPAVAEDRVREAISRWPSRSFYLQHWWALIVGIETALYNENGARAWELVNARWNALRRSLLLNVQYVRVESRYHRAMAALALASQEPRRRQVLRRAALDDAKRIEREKLHWGDPLARVIRAAGEPRAALAHLRAAEAGFEHADMRLFAAATHRRTGELIGGVEGRDLVAHADSVMRSEGIVRPDRMTAALLPCVE